MLPMPTPTPASAMVARPAPISLAASGSMDQSPSLGSGGWQSVMQMDGVVEIDAGQDDEDIGLQEGDADLQARQRDDEGERRPTGEKAQRDHEAAEHLQHGVAGHHVREEPHREADRPREIGEDLDHN